MPDSGSDIIESCLTAVFKSKLRKYLQPAACSAAMTDLKHDLGPDYLHVLQLCILDDQWMLQTRAKLVSSHGLVICSNATPDGLVGAAKDCDVEEEKSATLSSLL